MLQTPVRLRGRCKVLFVEVGFLGVNVSKYGRDRHPIVAPAPTERPRATRAPVPRKVYVPVVKTASSTAGRSYAEAVMGAPHQPTTPVSSPISLKVDTFMKTWLSSAVLVGEVCSLDHLSSLPSVLIFGDGILVDVKYLGDSTSPYAS